MPRKIELYIQYPKNMVRYQDKKLYISFIIPFTNFQIPSFFFSSSLTQIYYTQG